MKKVTYALIALMCGIFTSCMDSEEIEILKDVTITIQPSSVLSSFAGFKQGDLDMYSDKNGVSKLRICALIYDEEGKLVVEKSTLLNDYSADYTLTLNALDLKKKYQILVVSNAIQGTLESPSYQSYSLSNKSDINKLTVTQEFSNSYASNWSVLGLGKQEINPNTNTNYLVKLQPGTAMFIHFWENVHTYDRANVDKYLFIFHNNNQVLYNGDWAYATTLPENNNNSISLDVTQNPGNSIYDIYNLLPVSSMHYFGRLFIGEQKIDFTELSSKGDGTVGVVAGNTYEVNFNCLSFEIDINKKASRSVDNLSERNKSSIEKQNMGLKQSVKVLNIL